MPLQICIEFYGSVRLRAGESSMLLPADDIGITVGQALSSVTRRFPQLIGFCCGSDGALQPGFVVNVDGQLFTRDDSHRLLPGQTLLVLSADVGG
ncbi:MAG: MoaD/ThiS family protein [Planctomycetota bacterium]|nr:MoaD/ThiS family protein [Planctomycetota bacterium]MDA1180000.1 MoaD/ThiS family protein [Planctomycetota bacterium]